MSEKDVIEKRNYPRCPIQLPLYYQRLNTTDANEKKSAQYWTKNVSLGGMCFETQELLQHESTLDIELHLPKENYRDYVSQDPMRLEGKVVWSGQKRTQSNLFEIGVEFVSIKEYDQDRIEECLEFFLQKQAWEDKEKSEVVCDLASQECVPCKGGVDPLKGPALANLLELLGNSWQLIDGQQLEKEYTFKNFREALAFTNSVGELAEAQGHHPDIFLAWGKVKLTVWTHKIGGLTESDFIFAAKADQVL